LITLLACHQEGGEKADPGQGCSSCRANSRATSQATATIVCQLHRSNVYDSIPFNSHRARSRPPLDLPPAGAAPGGGGALHLVCHRDYTRKRVGAAEGWQRGQI